MIFDTHVHYNLPPLFDRWESCWKEAQSHGVTKSIVVGTDQISNIRAMKLAETDGLYCSVGYHPHENDVINTKLITENLAALIATSKKVVAIGECGLDYFKLPAVTGKIDHIRTHQHELLQAQRALATELNLPLIIHCRDAYDDMITVMKGWKMQHALPKIVLHCMSGSVEYLHQALELGCFISFAGNITYKNAELLRELAAHTPLDRIFVETDAPFLSPEPHRGKTNEPWFITETVKMLGQIHHLSPDDIAKKTYDNAAKFFAIR